MILFIICHDLLLLYLNWDLLGLISYLLINYWCSKVNCGIKAIIYNRLGDLSILYLLSITISLLCILGNYGFTSFYLIINLINLLIVNQLNSTVILSILLILFTKSAQLPFSSWLLNAMNAPTPISALLHSSTMVIASVYLGIIMQQSIKILVSIYISINILFIVGPAVTLIWSVVNAVISNDIKAIIALSTISQLSYMYIALLINPLIVLFHIITHALFKSLLFILVGSIIHVSIHQSLYNSKIDELLIKILFLLSSLVLVLSISKELIIYSSSIHYISALFFFILSLGAIFTLLYIINLYLLLFIILIIIIIYLLLLIIIIIHYSLKLIILIIN